MKRRRSRAALKDAAGDGQRGKIPPGGVLVAAWYKEGTAEGHSSTNSGVGLNPLTRKMERRVGTTSWGSSERTWGCE